MAQPKRVKICIAIALRDYSAFEDLANELGCPVEILELNPDNEKVQRRKKRHILTKTDKEAILKYYKKYGGTCSEIKQALSLP